MVPSTGWRRSSMMGPDESTSLIWMQLSGMGARGGGGAGGNGGGFGADGGGDGDGGGGDGNGGGGDGGGSARRTCEHP